MSRNWSNYQLSIFEAVSTSKRNLAILPAPSQHCIWCGMTPSRKRPP